MDFGMSFSEENQYFSEFLKPRGSNTLTDLIELGILPKIKGLYREDYAKHMDFGGDEETEFSGILLTHAHVDHCAYIKYLRPDIPIYCSEESKLIMQNFDETGNGEQYLTMKEKFQFHDQILLEFYGWVKHLQMFQRIALFYLYQLASSCTQYLALQS